MCHARCGVENKDSWLEGSVVEVSIRALSPSTMSQIEASAAASTFWELPPPHSDNEQRMAHEDPTFDKQVWMQQVLLEWGICGYTAFVGTGDQGAQCVPAATVFFAPARYMCGIGQLPTAPISPDAILLSAVHVALPYMGLYLEHQLIDTVLTEAHRRGIKAVEAFARVEDFDYELILNATGGAALPQPLSAIQELNYIPESYRGWDEPQQAHTGDPVTDRLSTAPMLSEDILEAEGFSVVQHHPRFPRYRAEITGASSMFARFAEEDHKAMNGPEMLRTVTGGGLIKSAARALGVRRFRAQKLTK